MENLPTNTVPATEPRKVAVNCKADLNAAVTEHAFKLTPCDGWTGCAKQQIFIKDCRHPSGTCYPRLSRREYCTDPTASFALEERMREIGWEWQLQSDQEWNAMLMDGGCNECAADHPSRFIAMVLAALSACGVEVELVEGWETR